MRRLILRTFFALGCAAAAATVRAQTSPPGRPRLERDQDGRDWRSYLSCAVMAESYKDARACLYWAARLDPSRAEPLYAEWMLGEQKNDSVHREALMRDPFVYQARVATLGERKYGVFSSPAARAWGALAAGNYFDAARNFDVVLAADSSALDARWGAAIAQYYRRKLDSSAMHVRALDDALRRKRERTLQGVYTTFDFLGFMEGVAWLAGGRRDSARAALERAVGENVAFYPASMLLGDLALERGDTATADQLWAQAAELQQSNGYVRGRYGQYLLRRRRFGDAEQELRATLALEPHWVDAHWALARALDAQGGARVSDATAAFREFLRRAPAADSARRSAAAQRVGAAKAP